MVEAMNEVEEALDEVEEAKNDFGDTFPRALDHVGLGVGLELILCTGMAMDEVEEALYEVCLSLGTCIIWINVYPHFVNLDEHLPSHFSIWINIHYGKIGRFFWINVYPLDFRIWINVHYGKIGCFFG